MKMTVKKNLGVFVLFSGFFMAASGAEAAFYGNTVRVTEEFSTNPTTTTDVVAGNGVELRDFGNFVDFSIDIRDTSILLSSSNKIPGASGVLGFGFTDSESTINDFISVSISDQIGFEGLADTNLMLSEDRLSINFDNVSINAGDTVSIDVGFREDGPAVIPLPATAPLALGAFAALGVFGRRRSVRTR